MVTLAIGSYLWATYRCLYLSYLKYQKIPDSVQVCTTTWLRLRILLVYELLPYRSMKEQLNNILSRYHRILIVYDRTIHRYVQVSEPLENAISVIPLSPIPILPATSNTNTGLLCKFFKPFPCILSKIFVNKHLIIHF